MAISHAKSAEVIDIMPLGANIDSAHDSTQTHESVGFSQWRPSHGYLASALGTASFASSLAANPKQRGRAVVDRQGADRSAKRNC